MAHCFPARHGRKGSTTYSVVAYLPLELADELILTRYHSLLSSVMASSRLMAIQSKHYNEVEIIGNIYENPGLLEIQGQSRLNHRKRQRQRIPDKDYHRLTSGTPY